MAAEEYVGFALHAPQSRRAREALQHPKSRIFREQMPALPLIGRENESEWLARHLAAPDDEGRGRALLITGEAGIGKTHFLNHAIPSERTLVRVTFPRARFAAPGSGLRKLASTGGAAGRALAAELDETTEAAGGWKLLSICKRADEVLASHPRKVVIFDDLQWADELTMSWLSRADDLLESQQVVVLAVRASEHLPTRVLDATSSLRRAGLLHPLELGPLTVPEIGRLAEHFGFPASGSLATALHQRTNGLPLAVEELLREAERRGMGLRDIDTFERIEIPSSLSVLSSVVREQTGALSPDAREVLAVIALMPQPADEDPVRRVTGMSRSRYDTALEEVLTSGFLTRLGPTVVRFRHELQREALQAQMGIARCRALHARIAQVLAQGTNHPAGMVAEQFVSAGLTSDALEWLELASIEAARAHDHGNALTHLAAAIRMCAFGDSETRTRLAERCVVAARSSNQPSTGVELVEEALAATTEPRLRGRLYLCLTRLVSFVGDNEARAAALNDARESFAGTGDDAGMARVLGEMALPTGKTLPIETRIALGREGLSLAERSKDPAAISLCAANLAVAELRSGDPRAFARWARAVEAYREGSASAEQGEEIVRNRTNWAIGALDYGSYPEAERVLAEGEGLWENPFWKEFFHCLKALHLWRVGKWDLAVEQAQKASAGVSRPEVTAMAVTIQTAIAFERDPHPVVDPLVGAAASLLELADEQWGAVAQSILMRIRAARREPRPERGLNSLLSLIAGTGVRIGWDDLLPTVASIDTSLYRRSLNLLGGLQPAGARAEVSSLFARGLGGLQENDEDAAETLLEAARLYESLPDPFFAAKAYEAAARAHSRRGQRAGEERVRAAEIYRDIGADRSLAHLLRSSGNTRALDGFRVPPTQAHAGAPGLTRREREIAELARQGYTTREMAALLGISPTTAKKHLERVKAKLQVKRKSDLVRLLSAEQVTT
jgi:DNA-binding CsgD family transcriptional regulator